MGALSIQVLQELFVSLTRKLPSPVDVATARSIVADLATWRVVEPRTMHILSAIEAAHRWQVSFWDAMILTNAQLAGAVVVWTEDLNDGQSFDGMTGSNRHSRTQLPDGEAAADVQLDACDVRGRLGRQEETRTGQLSSSVGIHAEDVARTSAGPNVLLSLM